VGTHAILEDNVEIPNLALVVIDEQHKFGVLQRLRLQQKEGTPHALFMTATPIPRTLMLTCYGDLDKSVISELPPGRIPPKTYFARDSKLDQTWAFCREQIEKGRQIYVVYPLVAESEKIDLKAACEGHEELQKTAFSGFKVGLLHGQLPQEEKTSVMRAYKGNDFQVLVATTVIEVGVDVPNATTMVIMHAERFGLSQLHQLRGRIGRGGGEAHCFLIGDPKSLSSQKRIQAMLKTHDGFQLAEYDLAIRGPGDMLGTRQAGLLEMAMGDPLKDEPLLMKARQAVEWLIETDLKLLESGPIFETSKQRQRLVGVEALN